MSYKTYSSTLSITFVLLTFSLFGQSATSVKNSLSIYFQQGDSLLKAKEFERALNYFDSSLQIEDSLEHAYALVLTARVYDNLGKMDEALKYYSEAERWVRNVESNEPLNYYLLYYSFHLDRKREMAKSKKALLECVNSVSLDDYTGAYILSHAHKVLATNGLITGDLDSVYYHITQMNSFLEKDETKGIYPDHYNAIAWYHYKTGDLGSALKILTKYLEAYGVGLDEIEPDHAPIVGNIGITYMHLGDYERGEKYQLAINEMLEKKGDTNTHFYQGQLGVLANCYFNMKRYDESLNLYNRQIEIYKSINKNYRTPYYYEKIVLEKCQVLAALGRWNEAKPLVDEILQFFSHPEYNDYSLLDVYLFKGMAEILAERFEDAVSSLNKSKKILTDQKNQHSSIAVPVITNLADAYAGNGRHDLAISYMDTALWINQGKRPFNADSLSNIGVLRWQIEIYNDKLEILKRAWKSSGDTSILNNAFETIDKANLTLDYARKVIVTDESKLRIAEDFYQYAVYFHLEKHKHSENPDDLWSALSYNENNKSFLLNTLTSQRLISDDPMYLNLLDLREEMKQQMNSSAAQNDAQNQYIYFDKLDSLQLLIDDYAEYRHFREIDNQWVKKNYPNQQILSIHLGQESLFCFLITNSEISLKEIEITSDFNDELSSYRNYLTNPTANNPQIDWMDELVDWISPHLKDQLIIIPDGALNYLPFEILSSTANPETFLMEKSSISYLNSLSQPHSEDKKNGRSGLISFAPAFESTSPLARTDVVRSELSTLPGAFEEVIQVERIFGGEAITREEATETRFRESAIDSDIIHLATHAIVDDANPELSRLIFYSSNDSLNDGYLHFHEIYGLDLSASMVTLSACNTGFGKIKKGEGVMSLSRAFAYAGVPATVVSLWPASDKSTPELMKYFYQNLKEGQAKDVALNNARKQYLATAQGKARHPFYWGGFVLIGDNSPIEDDTNLLAYVIPSVLVFVMILTIYRRRKGRA